MSHCLVSFRGLEAPAWVLSAIAAGRVPGVCLFAFNFASLEQFRELTASLFDAARAGGQPPPLVGIDQEGGQLMAIGGGATELPGNMALGAARSAALAGAAGRILGRELSALGCNLNFAPVLDLASRPRNPVVGLRAFGDDPALVGALGVAMIEGMQAEGVLACAKHFPGHGNTLADSHHATASVDRSLEELLALELRPFEDAFAAGLAAVMTAHVHYPLLEDVPATFSSAVLVRLLRERLGYDGLVITDALDMHALAAVAPGERARRSLEAGADLAILGHLPDQQTIVAALEGAAFPAAQRRITAVRAALAAAANDALEPRRAPLRLAWPQHAREARAMAEAAITVVSGSGRLPLRLAAGDRLCVVSVSAGNLTPAETVGGTASLLPAQVARRHPNTISVGFEFTALGTGGVVDAQPNASSEAAAPATAGATDAGTAAANAATGAIAAAIAESIDAVLDACRGAAAVLLATIDAASDPGQQRLFAALREQGHEPLLLALRSPADVAVLRGTRASLCSYGRREDQTEAAVAVIFGERPATGRLPVSLAGIAPTPTSAGVTA